MLKTIIDTNVLVSALIQRNYPFFIVNDLFIKSKITLCISNSIFNEYVEVLARKKFSIYYDFAVNAQQLLNDIKMKAVIFTPVINLSIIQDESDNKFLELAAESKADFLITGNTNDFKISSYLNTEIVTPKIFWDIFHSQK